ncbi:helix-turn-helix domain-containing protein [Haloechinothrix salitolerans]|uniref:Helix-turn-helix domain-containing protein n=1 Tax=Haloechinothrix salitolerans TaxID=926830 RepID=A0ABW2C6V2_9PSEU
MTYRTDTGDVGVRDRMEYWRDAICEQFVPLRVEPSRDTVLRGKVAASSLGPLEIRDLTATPHHFVRTSTLIRRSDEDYVKVGMMELGSSVFVQDGREAVLQPGDFVLYDSTRPYSVAMARPFQIKVCMLPKRLLPLREAELTRATAVALPGSEGIGAVVRAFVRELAGTADSCSPGTGEALALSVADLVTAVVRGRSEASPAIDEGLNPLLVGVRAYIRDHLADRNLSPASIAAASSISVSYLHKLFAQTDTTVAGYIRELRLQRCWRDLRDPRLSQLTVTAIGMRWGIGDPAHLSRMFKARFGMSPIECRALAP